MTVLHELRSHRAWQPDCATLARSRVAAARSAAGLTPEEFAAALTSMVGRPVLGGHVEAWETRSTPPGDVLVACDAFSPASTWLGVRSHKFICGWIGAADSALIADHAGTVPAVFGGLECQTATVAHPSGPALLTLWPCGSVVIHVPEDLEVPDIATLAGWRVRTYVDDQAWATSLLRSLKGDDQPEVSYVLSAYWVTRAPWSGQVLGTAMRLLSAPRVLLEHGQGQGGAAEAERHLLAAGYEHSGMRDFGMRGVSSGFASWSGVSYFAADPDRALAEADLTELEMTAQAMWAYSAHVISCAEEGRGPAITGGYGYRWLRGARSRLVSPRPQETGQHQAMREAIIETSGLPAQMAQAVELLREDHLS